MKNRLQVIALIGPIIMNRYEKLLRFQRCICLFGAFIAVLINYLIWSYEPDTRFETLETVLFPAIRALVAVVSIGLVVNMYLDPLTNRVLRILRSKSK